MEPTLPFVIDWVCIYLSNQDKIEHCGDEELVMWLQKMDDKIVSSDR